MATATATAASFQGKLRGSVSSGNVGAPEPERSKPFRVRVNGWRFDMGRALGRETRGRLNPQFQLTARRREWLEALAVSGPGSAGAGLDFVP